MEVDNEKLKEFFEATIKGLKALDSELLAYRMVFQSLKMFDLAQYEILNQAFQVFLNSDAVHKQMKDKYDTPLEALLNQFSQAALDQVFLQWLQDWKPESPKN